MPRFLSVAEVHAIHDDQIARYGGTHSCPDLAGLASAVAMPQAAYSDDCFHEARSATAAAWLLSIVAGHPFLDGSKGTGMVVAGAFMQLNGYGIPESDEQAFEAIVLGVARGDIGKSEVAAFFRQLPAPMADE